jgi:hypothetical protein
VRTPLLLMLFGLTACSSPEAPAERPREAPPAVEEAPSPAATEATPAEAATPAAASSGPTFKVLINDDLRVAVAGAEPSMIATLPLDASSMQGARLGPLYDAAMAAISSGLPPPRADLHVAKTSPLIRQDFGLILATLASTPVAGTAVFLDDAGPLVFAAPVVGPVDAPTVEPRVSSALVLLHRDPSTSWATASASWSESPGFVGGPRPGHRPPVSVPLIGDEGCTLLKPGPSRNLGPGLHARLTTFGIEATTPLLLAATPHTALTDELALGIDLQGRGWTVTPMGSRATDPPKTCPGSAQNAAQLAAGKDTLLAQKPR